MIFCDFHENALLLKNVREQSVSIYLFILGLLNLFFLFSSPCGGENSLESPCLGLTPLRPLERSMDRVRPLLHG